VLCGRQEVMCGRPSPARLAGCQSSNTCHPPPWVQVHQALSALQQAQQHIAAGAYQAAGAAAQQAHAAAEAAFLHPAVLAQLNFPESHKLGIYMPLFLPVSVPLMQGLATEGVRSLRRWRSYRAGAAAV